MNKVTKTISLFLAICMVVSSAFALKVQWQTPEEAAQELAAYESRSVKERESLNNFPVVTKTTQTIEKQTYFDSLPPRRQRNELIHYCVNKNGMNLNFNTCAKLADKNGISREAVEKVLAYKNHK